MTTTQKIMDNTICSIDAAMISIGRVCIEAAQIQSFDTRPWWKRKASAISYCCRYLWRA